MGYHHEPFSDEAQSYLIARDVPLIDLIKNVARVEGSPVLWFLWLKILIFFGLSYKYIYLSSLLPNFFGVSLFIYKAPFSKIIKYLFPLTYFIFFQYNIVARSYSLILLFVTLAAIYYPKRQDYPWVYLIILIFLSQITVYTLLLATGIFFMGIWEDWFKKEIKYPSLAVYTIYLFLAVAVLFPTSENQYFLSLSRSKSVIAIKIISAISSGLITYGGYNLSDITRIDIGIIYFICLMVSLFRLNAKATIFLLIPVLLFSCYANKLWHSGIMLLSIMLILWLNNKKISLDLSVLISLLLMTQIIWSAHALITDKNKEYSVGHKVYTFLQSQNISDSQVLKLTFNATAVCPYFKTKECTYWDWKKYGFERKESEENIRQYQAFIINQAQYGSNPLKWDEIGQNSGYLLKKFKTNHFVAFYDNSVDETLYVYYRI